MASSGPLLGPDAKTPAFPKIFFLTKAVVLPALAGARAADGTITKPHNHQAVGAETIRRARRSARGSGAQESREGG